MEKYALSACVLSSRFVAGFQGLGRDVGDRRRKRVTDATVVVTTSHQTVARSSDENILQVIKRAAYEMRL